MTVKKNQKENIISWPNPPFFYDFKKEEYQMIYVGEFFGTTFVMAANLKYSKKDGKNLITGTFRSKNVGGTIKFAIGYISRFTVIEDSANPHLHNLEVKLVPFTDVDQDTEAIIIQLDDSFKVGEHSIRIDIENEDIIGLNDSQIFIGCEEVNNERSCDFM